MKITRIAVHQVDLPLVEGRYSWSGGKFVEVFDSTLVRIDTDAGITGWARSARSVRSICRPTATARAPASRSSVRT